VLVYRLDDRLFFANARYFKARVREAVRAAPAEVSWLVFDAEAVTHADSTGLEALDTLTNDLRRVDITLVVARLRTRLQGQFGVAGVTATIRSERFYPSVHAAVDAYVALNKATPSVR
jgi:sulfate permease, SulP family